MMLDQKRTLVKRRRVRHGDLAIRMQCYHIITKVVIKRCLNLSWEAHSDQLIRIRRCQTTIELWSNDAESVKMICYDQTMPSLTKEILLIRIR
ncbi:hypothetical protein GQ457_06G010020 [Hibiscus cannabinus]